MRHEERLLTNLRDLVAQDLTKVDLESLVAGVHEAEETADLAVDWSGKFIAEMRRRGISWSQIVRLTGMPQTTLHNRASPPATKRSRAEDKTEGDEDDADV